MRYFLGILGVIVGMLLVWKTYALAQIFGSIPWAERNLGSGSTYVVIKLIGLVFVVLSLMYLFGIVDILVFPFRGVFGGLVPR